ncbi:tRNA nuclease CdiA-2 [Pararobbsia alpina]|uniref:tRNA nuclease CdiA-2 n=1 Tax=Pararobbsia alpina TaxID=621374 RepID=A0A6S7CWQ5_9BURK|nr:tRNA nuclease CdiA-2 [Pararobbsia alpina]
MKLAADGNVKITTSQDTQTTSSAYQKHESGVGTSGGIGISVGSKTQTDRSNTSRVTHIGSTIGSLNGNLNIAAGDELHVSGSDLIAAKDVSGTGANVTIDAAADTMHHDETHEVKQSGFTLALKAPVLDALSNTVDQAHAASRSQDSGAAALHGMAAASGAVDMVGTGGAAAGALANGQTPEAKIELSYGSSHSKSTFAEDSTTNKGASVTAGGTAAFVATGHGAPTNGASRDSAASGNVTIAGSNVKANDVLLAASNQVNLVNTTDTDSTRSTNVSSSASVGVSYGTQGLGVSASRSKAHGDDNSDATMQNDTHVKGANSVQIVSGGDTNLIGAHVSGKQVTADIGGNLTIASVQDTATSRADQESSGGGFSISQGGGSASFSHTSGSASGRYAGVNEQAGIQAGSNGFNINVQATRISRAR